LGAIYAMVALEINIVYIATGVFNFAQAQIVMLGLFMVYLFGDTLHLPVIPVIVLATVSCALIAVLEEVSAIRPLVRMAKRGGHAELVTTLGASALMGGIALVIWGGQPLPVKFPGPTQSLSVLGGQVLPVQLLLLAFVALFSGLLYILMARTRFGLAARAVAENREAAMLRGVNTSRVSLVAFAIAGGVAGFSAFLVAPVTYAVYDFGDSVVLFAFVGLAIAGYGSITGALTGSLLVGLVTSFSERYLNYDWSPILIFALLLGLLSVRPSGLFGKTTVRAV
jgi:branched-chain amino acid transport system permease protein